MASSRSFGILELERDLSPDAPRPNPSPGSLRHPNTFEHPAIFETVPGAWVENVVRGDPSLELPYVKAAQRLVERGAIAISSNCGFSIRHQTAIAAAVNVPVIMSSLLLIPALLRQLPAFGKISVLTYDSAHCSEDLLGVDDATQRARIIVGGIEGGEFWHNELKRPVPPTSVASIEADVAACVERLRRTNPEIAVILLECAGFPIVAPAIRRLTRLPVYDIVSLCRATAAALG
ncbi:hypothetical protein [Bradyrhizobium sp. 191]|uniref:hypothetical protein n=1 Tax=Bradyrhizobium sp. 191 TaxID=2782659 RepID=UPI001FFE7571|nr:hypothetical protein [Bradyrhizobium sp. 191]